MFSVLACENPPNFVKECKSYEMLIKGNYVSIVVLKLNLCGVFFPPQKTRSKSLELRFAPASTLDAPNEFQHSTKVSAELT